MESGDNTRKIKIITATHYLKTPVTREILAET